MIARTFFARCTAEYTEGAIGRLQAVRHTVHERIPLVGFDQVLSFTGDATPINSIRPVNDNHVEGLLWR